MLDFVSVRDIRVRQHILFKADMKSYILLQTGAKFYSIEPISKTGY